MSSNKLVEVKNLYLSFDREYYSRISLRDLFVQTVTSPLKTYLAKQDTHKVLENISFEINKGDRVGLLGMNGAGKTTLCHCLAKMLKPQHGELNVPSNTRAIFNHASPIDPFLTGRENAVMLGNYLYPQLNFKELEDVVEEACDFSELKSALDTPMYTYSLGMESRLFLSMVTAIPCDLLILDEVYDGADEHFKLKIQKRLKKLIENSGAVILVSHNSDLFERLCNKILFLENQKIKYIGDDIKHALDLYHTGKNSL